MSIRARLLALAIGGVVPLLIVSLVMLWLVWSEKQNQLNEAVEQQAELSAVVFDRWLDAQYQPLRTIASFQQGRPNDRAVVTDVLKAARSNHTHWIDLRILDANARALAIDPVDAGDLPSGVAEKLLSEAQRNLPDVETEVLLALVRWGKSQIPGTRLTRK